MPISCYTPFGYVGIIPTNMEPLKPSRGPVNKKVGIIPTYVYDDFNEIRLG